MIGYVYLVRNGNLFNLGWTTNLEKRLNELNPDEIVATLQTAQPEKFAARLQSQYSEVRLPLSEYFRLNNFQLSDCKATLLKEGANSISPVAKRFKAFILFLLAWVILSCIVILFLVDPLLDRFM